MSERESSPPPIPRRMIGVLGGIVLAAGLLSLPPPAGMPIEAWYVAAIAGLMAVWWVSEAIPLAATALVPLAVFPTLEVAPIGEIAAPYANPLVFLMLGGFMLGQAMQATGLHRRLALAILRRAGARADGVVGGFLVATACLSMWISNTATAAMMLPIGLSVLELVEEGAREAEAETTIPDLAPPLLLAVAYGANIGGIGTLIGTPPNAVLAAFMADSHDRAIGFAQWMGLGVPVVVLLLAIAWLVLTRIVFRVGNAPLAGIAHRLGRERRRLGASSPAERRFAVVFVLVGLAWLSRPLLERLLPGLVLSDAGIAITGALALFLVPAGDEDDTARPLLDWDQVRGLPWNVLLLIGGGLGLGTAIETSGLAAWTAEALGGLAGLPTPAVVIAVALVAMLASHVMSNTATAAALLPLVASLAGRLGLDPLRLGVPTVLACSCAFMLPVATPPNAIVHGSGRIATTTMVRAGAILGAAALMIVLLASRLLVRPVFGVAV